MTKRVWKSGPPPHVGWWEADYDKEIGWWRWWDGCGWSICCTEKTRKEDAGKDAAIRLSELVLGRDQVYWTDYYPENARVPRINPNK